jgi:hypothetical protein
VATLRIGNNWEKVPYLVSKSTGYHWQPSKKMRGLGFDPEPLGKDVGAAVIRARELNQAWKNYRKNDGPAGPARNTLAWVIKQYEDDDWYKDLRDKTKLEYDWGIRQILKAPMAKHQIDIITRKSVRTLHKKYTASLSRGQANKIVKVLRRLLSFAIEMEIIENNPALDLKLKHSKGRRQRWDREHIPLFVEKAIEMDRGAWALAVKIGYDSSQRLGDILSAHPRQFDGEGIDWTQSKTDEDVWTPLQPSTIALMKEMPRESISNIVAGRNGKPITLFHFNRVFNQISKAAGLPSELQFRDLRRTAASEVLDGGGRAEPLTGHKPNSPILKVYQIPSKEAARTSQRARKKSKK